MFEANSGRYTLVPYNYSEYRNSTVERFDYIKFYDTKIFFILKHTFIVLFSEKYKD